MTQYNFALRENNFIQILPKILKVFIKTTKTLFFVKSFNIKKKIFMFQKKKYFQSMNKLKTSFFKYMYL